MASTNVAKVRASAARKWVLILAKACSMGLKSGEYAGNKQHFAASAFDQGADCRPLMHVELIHDHHLAGLEAGHQQVPDIGRACRLVSTSLHDQRRTHPLRRQGGKERDVGTVIARDAAARPLATGSPRPQAGHRGVGATLIDEDEAGGVERGHVGPPVGACGVIPFAGLERLFFSGQPKRASARDRVASLRCTPFSAAHWAQCSRKVASGRARTWASNARSWTRPIRRGRPGRGCAATLPRSRCRRRQRTIVAGPTPKRRAASAWLRPASMARSSRSRRSTEYCFTHASIAHDQLFRRDA